MSDETNSERKFKIVSLLPKVVVINKIENQEQVNEVELGEETDIVNSLIEDYQEKFIENISEIVDKAYDEFSHACETRNLNWEAELEFGVEFGVRFLAKLKISPRQVPPNSL